MIRKYLVVEFHEAHRHPIGASNPVRLDRRNDMELYRDLDADPGTLVAVTAACTMEYPWSEVKQSVVEKGPPGAEQSLTRDTSPEPDLDEVDVDLDEPAQAGTEQETAVAKRRPRTKE